VQYSVRDRLSERMSLDSSGNVLGVQSHLPFGEDFAESGTQEKHHFTTYERDSESGGDYAMNREYSPGTGRFGGVDAGAARPKDPQTFNRYAYTRNNPIEYVDSQGLDCQPWLHVEYWQGDDGGIVVDWSNTYVYEVCSPDDVQGGGNGAGTGGGVSNGAGQFGSMVKNFFNTHTGCKNFFTNNTPASWGTSGSLSFLTWMEHVGTYAQFVDITQRSNRSFAGETLGALGLVPSTDPEANFLLGQVINPPGIAGAITAPVSSSDEWLSYIGGNFHAASAIDQEVTITHEVLHMASQFDDPGVTSSLGLQVPQGVSPSSVISDWLKADCPDPKTYKYPTSGN
ncbi:MAG: RHS repeat-associated core domain-containing protein, partial [Blastocatellia bacterium]